MNQSLKTYDELVELLYLLDKALERKYPDSELSVKLEVVGGFALLYHGLRIENHFSRDIDTYNDISSWLWKTAYDIDDSNWLNDGPTNLLHKVYPSIKNHIKFVKDTKYRFPYDHLELWVATLDSVLGMKLDALRRQAEEGHSLLSTNRLNDITDFKEIVSVFDIDTPAGLLKEYPYLRPFFRKSYIKTDEKISKEDLEKMREDNTVEKINLFEKFVLFEKG